MDTYGHYQWQLWCLPSAVFKWTLDHSMGTMMIQRNVKTAISGWMMSSLDKSKSWGRQINVLIPLKFGFEFLLVLALYQIISTLLSFDIAIESWPWKFEIVIFPLQNCEFPQKNIRNSLPGGRFFLHIGDFPPYCCRPVIENGKSPWQKVIAVPPRIPRVTIL